MRKRVPIGITYIETLCDLHKMRIIQNKITLASIGARTAWVKILYWYDPSPIVQDMLNSIELKDLTDLIDDLQRRIKHDPHI